MSREPAQLAVVRSIIRLGETLRLQVVAEGIEDGGQLTNLRSLGARFGQGFMLGEPMPPAEIERNWLAQTPRRGREVA
jgi:EAL domain-containing protein (putative c-di-GMP-specific phosphodiesterase class I)